MQAAGCSWESTDFPSHAAGEFEAEHCTAWGVIVKGLGSCTTEQLPKVDLISLPLRKGKSWSDQSLILDPKDLCPARKYSSGWFRNHFDILANGSLKQDKGIELCKDLWSHLPTGTRWFFFLTSSQGTKTWSNFALFANPNQHVGWIIDISNQPHISIQQSLHASQRPLSVQKIRRNVSKPEAFRRDCKIWSCWNYDWNPVSSKLQEWIFHIQMASINHGPWVICFWICFFRIFSISACCMATVDATNQKFAVWATPQSAATYKMDQDGPLLL